MIKKFLPIIYIIILKILLITSVYAQTEPVISIGTVLLPPWGYFDEQDRPKGILYEIANEIAETIGLPYHNQILPASRLLRDLENNIIDFTIIYRTPNSEKIGIPIAQVYSNIQNIVIGRYGLNIKNYDQLNEQTLAIPRGGKYGEPFDSDTRLKRIFSNEYMHSLVLLTNNRVKTVVGSRQTLFYCADKLGLKLDFFGYPYLLNETEEWVHVSKESKIWVKTESIQASLNRLRRSGKLKMLEKKYLPDMFYRTKIKPGLSWPLPKVDLEIKE